MERIKTVGTITGVVLLACGILNFTVGIGTIYIGFQQTKLLKMLQNMLLKLDSISDWYVESLADELDAATIDKLLSGFSKVGKVREAIIDLERQIRAEEVSTGRVRGDAKVNDYELPKK